MERDARRNGADLTGPNGEPDGLAEREPAAAAGDELEPLDEAPSADEVATRPAPAPVASDGDRRAGTLWLLLTAILTVGALLFVIKQSNAWDPFSCETDEDCRGEKQCIEAQCISPEVFERTTGREAPERQSRRSGPSNQGPENQEEAPE